MIFFREISGVFFNFIWSSYCEENHLFCHKNIHCSLPAVDKHTHYNNGNKPDKKDENVEF